MRSWITVWFTATYVYSRNKYLFDVQIFYTFGSFMSLPSQPSSLIDRLDIYCRINQIQVKEERVFRQFTHLVYFVLYSSFDFGQFPLKFKVLED